MTELGLSEFIQAVSTGDLGTVQRFLFEDPDYAEIRCEGGESIIQRAVYYGQPLIVEALLSVEPDYDMGTACAIGDLDGVIELLTEDRGEVNRLSGDGFLPLCLAAAFNQPQIVAVLLEAGADPNLRSTALGGVAPLDSAVFGKNPEIVKMLLRAGADPNSPQAGGFTPLHGAAQNQDHIMAQHLISHGANRTLVTDDGMMAADFWGGVIEVAAYDLDDDF